MLLIKINRLAYDRVSSVGRPFGLAAGARPASSPLVTSRGQRWKISQGQGGSDTPHQALFRSATRTSTQAGSDEVEEMGSDRMCHACVYLSGLLYRSISQSTNRRVYSEVVIGSLRGLLKRDQDAVSHKCVSLPLFSAYRHAADVKCVSYYSFPSEQRLHLHPSQEQSR